MKKKSYLPFQNMTPKGWLNLALTTMVAIYIFQIGFVLGKGDICDSFAYDYCAFWSAGRIINKHGMAAVYDLDLLTQYQKEIYPNGSNPNFVPSAIMYLPLFIIPFKLLSLIDLPTSFIIWTLVNIIGFIVYLVFFTKSIFKSHLSFRILSLIVISLPVVVNFTEGQVNLLLCISAGEFLRAIISGKPYKAGIWLSGWLLKPQLLILIIPFLLIKRSMKAFLGFTLSTFVILLLSFGLIQTNGLLSLLNSIQNAANGGVASCPSAMMNWRMLGLLIGSLTSSFVGLFFIILGTLLTFLTTLIIFSKRISQDSTSVANALLGIFAATSAITWHAHLHMSIILIPPMLFLIMKNRFNKNLFYIWLFIPILTHLLSYFLAALIVIENIPISAFQILWLSKGIPGFIINLLILGWAIKQYTGSRNEISSEA